VAHITNLGKIEPRVRSLERIMQQQREEEEFQRMNLYEELLRQARSIEEKPIANGSSNETMKKKKNVYRGNSI
jgi:hypothetical protein